MTPPVDRNAAHNPTPVVTTTDGPTDTTTKPGQRKTGTVANTCGGCDATWTASRAAHCGACHRTFSGVDLFDRHRDQRGEHGACLDPATLTDTHGQPVMFFRDNMWRGPEMPRSAITARGNR